MSKVQDAIRSVKEEQRRAGSAPSSAGKASHSADTAKMHELRQLAATLTPVNIATLEKKHLENNRIICGDFFPDAFTSYKMLRTRVLQKMDKNNWRILAVTAAHEGAGKTITAINLAITVAQSGARNVFLLDLDLRKPGIARSFGMTDVDLGLGEYLASQSDLSSILWDVGAENLVVVPGTGRFENSSELLTSPPMNDLIAQICSDPSEPIIILDLPPVLMTDDALAVAPMVDCLLFVVAEGETKRADLTRTIELLQGVDVVGVVLNKSRDSQPGY